jgi:hypothetical protein
MHQEEYKKKCVNWCKHYDLHVVSKALNVQIKSLKRWLMQGHERKKGKKILLFNLLICLLA